MNRKAVWVTLALFFVTAAAVALVVFSDLGEGAEDDVSILSGHFTLDSADTSVPTGSSLVSGVVSTVESQPETADDTQLTAFIEKVIAVAEAQPQYPVDDGRTIYGALFGAPGAPWCTEFVMYCLKTAEDELDTDYIGSVYPWLDSAYATGLWFKRQNRYYPADGSFIPARGDLIIIDSDFYGYPNHTALCTGTVVENGVTYVTTIEGNIPEDTVKQIRCRQLMVNDPIIMGYCSTTVESPYVGSLTDYTS